MKLHCFANLYPLNLVAYYFFLFVLIFYFDSLFFTAVIFFDIIALNYFCGCTKETVSFLKYLFFFGFVMFISNWIFTQSIDIFSVRNFISFSSASILFLSFNKIIDSGKFLYICGKISPPIALIINICMRYIFVLQKNMQDFICIYLLNTGEKRGLKIFFPVIIKIFDWSINDCVEMITVLKAKNYNSSYVSSKIYRFSKNDLFHLCTMISSATMIFFGVAKIFLFIYLFLPLAYDFFCWGKFFLRGEKND